MKSVDEVDPDVQHGDRLLVVAIVPEDEPVVMSAAEAAYLKNPQVREAVERALDTPTDDLRPRQRRNR
jgi:hypothetical protein